MKKTRSRNTVILVGLIILLTLAACNSGGQSAPASESTPTSQSDQNNRITEKTTITVWVFGPTEGRRAGAEWLVENFKDVNPNVDVVLQYEDFASFSTKLLPAVAGGSPPDVLLNSGTNTFQLAHYGYLEPLDAYIERDGYPVGSIAESFWTDASYYNGSRYTLPYGAFTYNFIIRPETFEAAGLSAPTDWKDLPEIAKQLTDGDNSMWGLHLTNYPYYLYQVWKSWDADMTLVREENGKKVPGFVSDKVIEATEWYLNLFKVDGVSPPTTPTDIDGQIPAMWISGQVAMSVAGVPIWTTMFDEQDVSYEMIVPNPLFTGPEGMGHYSDVQCMVIFRDIPDMNKEAAWAFISWASQGEGAYGNMLRQGSIPLDVEAQDLLLSEKKTYQYYVDSINTATWASSFEPGAQNTMLNRGGHAFQTLSSAWRGEMTAEEFVHDLARVLQEELDEFYGQ